MACTCTVFPTHCYASLQDEVGFADFDSLDVNVDNHIGEAVARMARTTAQGCSGASAAVRWSFGERTMEEETQGDDLSSAWSDVPSLPKLILDTNVCGKLLTPAYRDDLEEIKRRLSRNFRVVVSAETFIELLNALKGGDGAHFESDKQRFRLMAGSGKPTFLRLPGAFTLSKVLGISTADTSSVSKLGPVDFQKWFRLTLRAKSRDEMLREGVRLPLDRRRLVWVLDRKSVV